MARVKLTQQYIDNPPPVPEGKTKVEHCDLALPGLLWEQRAVNQEWGSYRLRYKNSVGKTSYSAIGRSCSMTLAEARKKARQLKAEIQANGADPQAEVRERRKGLTWNAFFEDHYLPHAKQRLRSWKNLEEMHRLRVSPRFGHLKLDRIRKVDVQKFLNDLKDSGLSAATCDHHGKLIRQMLNVAVDWGHIKVNPVAGIKLFHEDNREERLMTDTELQRLMVALEKKLESTAYQVVKFLLYTGARVNEALHARWEDIDRDNRTWLIKATNSKSKRRRSVPLNASALEVLDKLATEGNSEWLFNSARGGRLTTIDKMWQKLREDADLRHVRLHDLRHYHASALVNSGRTLYEVMQILGHSDPSVTQRYAHLSTRSLQEASTAASDAIRKSAA